MLQIEVNASSILTLKCLAFTIQCINLFNE